MNKGLMTIAIVLGIILLIVAFIYLTTPASNLPQFFPGFDITTTKVHYKHGIGALILGLGAFVFVWFKTGKRSSKQE